MHKIFISYHHANDQYYKEELIRLNRIAPIFLNGSVETGNVSDVLDDQAIRELIRDDYLRDSTVTILLAGTETKNRKHVDWELYSSMFDGKVNKKSAVIVITLPSTGCKFRRAAHGNPEKHRLYPNTTSWVSIDSRAEYERRYPHLPDRIIDNLMKPEAKISITNWEIIENDWRALEFLINTAFNDRANCSYDLSRAMRRKDS